jgi:membrane glycosyltransferase
MYLPRRTLSFVFASGSAIIAGALATNVLFADGGQALDYVRVALLSLSVAWLAWGAAIGFNGVFASDAPERASPPPEAAREPGRVAVLVPVYNEDPVKTFSHVAAMVGSLAATGHGARFDFVILSDTTSPQIALQEALWFDRLQREADGRSTLYYRRREANVGKKAGNVADFIRTSGAHYEYLLILDADSLMEGATMVEMAARMEAEPRLGLLQTLPKIVRARSFFGRAVQFAASYYSPSFARGIATMQGVEGPFWGHNAIVRTRAFAQSCGLPQLSGRPPFGGHVLSHDYVEAALLARNDWIVRLDTDLEGSFEEGPENIIDYAKRDRRWCQGNLQHARIVAAPGLKPWSRFTLVQGIMAYLASPLWAVFLIVSIVSSATVGEPNYFPNPDLPAVFPRVEMVQAMLLLGGVATVLIGPKFLILARGLLTGANRGFRGTIASAASVVVEIVWSSILAPIMLMFQTRSVIQVLAGLDGGWPASNREADAVSLREAWDASWWICATGFAVMAATLEFAPVLYYWLIPVCVPLMISPLLIAATSQSPRLSYLFAVPTEMVAPPVMREQEAVLARWRGETNDSHPVLAEVDPTRAATAR